MGILDMVAVVGTVVVGSLVLVFGKVGIVVVAVVGSMCLAAR